MKDQLITVKEASKKINDRLGNWGTEELPLTHANGRILAENLNADRDFPPFDRVTMDGIAINFESFEKGQSRFPVVHMQAAGAPQTTLQDPTTAIEVMTGAIIPEGTNTVVKYEDTRQVNDELFISGEIRKGMNIHFKGEDRKEGAPLLHKGTVLDAPAIAVAATIGKSEVKVMSLPKTVVISTGDELVEVDQTPLPHQIRRSNLFAIHSALQSVGIQATLQHIPDDPVQVTEALKKIDNQFDLVIISGGVSKGKKDFFPSKLSEIGVVPAFDRVAQRPGKPFWFGWSERTTWFNLPGNPVPTYLCTLRYVLPWIKQSLGLPGGTPWQAILSEDVRFEKSLQFFLQVKIALEKGQLVAYPIPGNGSGDFVNLVNTTGFLELPMEKQLFKAGEAFDLWPYQHWFL